MKQKLKTAAAISAAAEKLLFFSEQRGLSLSKLSRLLGRNETYLQQFVTRGVPEELSTKDRLNLALILTCSLDELTNDKEEAHMFRSMKKKMTAEPFNLMTKTGWIRELGKVNAKTKRIDFTSPNGGVSGMATPIILIGVENAYTTTMPDNAMQPAIAEGAIVFVNPVRKPKNGDDVVIRFKDGTGTIRNLLGIFEKAGFMMVQQYNPAKEVSVPLSEVESVHLIAAVTRAESE